tara:strand:+ start:1930 stop:2301 length:372 start_codon:yes stop_codon:yes gene_type:complete
MPKEKIKDPTVIIVHLEPGIEDLITDSRKDDVLKEIARLEKTHVCHHTPQMSGFLDPNGWDSNRKYWICGLYYADSHEKDKYGDGCVDFQLWWFKDKGLDAEVYLPATFLATSHPDHIPLKEE